MTESKQRRERINPLEGPWVRWEGHESVFAGRVKENTSSMMKGDIVEILKVAEPDDLAMWCRDCEEDDCSVDHEEEHEQIIDLVTRAPDLLREVEELRTNIKFLGRLKADYEEMIGTLKAQNAELLEALEEEKQWYPKYLSADGRAIRAENLMKELMGTLGWLDRRGGLGHEAHDRIRAAIAKAKGGAE